MELKMAAKKKSGGKRASEASSSKKSTKAAAKPAGVSPRIKAILYATAAVFFTVMIFIKGHSLWENIRGFFLGVFGLGMMLVPAFFAYMCVITEKERAVKRQTFKIVLCVLIFLFLGAAVYVIRGAKYNDGMNYFACLGNLWAEASSTDTYFTASCGLIGGILGYPLVALCGRAVALVLSLLFTAALFFIVANLSVKDIASAAARRMERVREAGERQVMARKARRNAVKQARDPREDYRDSYNSIDIPYCAVAEDIDIPLDPEPRKKTKKKKVQSGIDIDISDPNEENAVDKDLSDDLLNIIQRAGKPMDQSADTTVEEIADNISQNKRSEHLSNGAKQPDPETIPLEAKKGSDQPNDEFENLGYNMGGTDNKDEKVYHYPPVQLLKPSRNDNDRSAMEELQHNSKKLIETLNSFGVNASIVNICRGPSVTRYELQPAPGVKISKITNLSDDIALNLAANGVRIEAPIPGKAAVGIEVPNKVVSMVSMRELIDSDEFRAAKSKLTAVLGRDISGEIVITDIAKMPHLLIAGTTGSGKSVCVNSILISILYKATPDEVKLLLIDPKMVEFSKYKGIPHLLVPIVSDAKKAAGALGWAVSEMLNRYKIFSEYDCKDIDSYNSLIEKNLAYIEKNPPVENEEGELVQPVLEINGLPVSKEKMSRIVIAIDELADLMMAAPGEVEDSICRLAQMARAAGMHLILATQRPTVNVITGLIKSNVPSRIALKVSSNMDSRTILDTGGGEKLIGKGDMLFSPVGAPKPIRVQGCYASEEEIEGVTGFIKKSYSAQYNAEIEETIKRIAVEEISGNKKSSSDEDDGLDVDSKMDEAIQIVIDAGQASTSLIQRRLKVGYARAGRMIDDMERMGVVGPHQGSKPREVLMTYNEWLERRNVLQNREN